MDQAATPGGRRVEVASAGEAVRPASLLPGSAACRDCSGSFRDAVGMDRDGPWMAGQFNCRAMDHEIVASCDRPVSVRRWHGLPPPPPTAQQQGPGRPHRDDRTPPPCGSRRGHRGATSCGAIASPTTSRAPQSLDVSRVRPRLHGRQVLYPPPRGHPTGFGAAPAQRERLGAGLLIWRPLREPCGCQMGSNQIEVPSLKKAPGIPVTNPAPLPDRRLPPPRQGHGPQ